MAAPGERRLADPLGAFAAHLGETLRRAIHPQCHEMTADPGGGERPFRHLGGRIVRAAGAEIGRARADVLRVGQHRLELPETGDAGGDLLRGADGAQDALAERNGDIVGVERALGGKQPVAAFVLLADDGGLHGAAVEVLAKLHLDQRTLLLNHDDRFEAAGEIGDVLEIERPGATDLEEAHADAVGGRLVDTDVFQRLADVEIALADGDDAELRTGAAGIDHAVQPVGADEGGRRGALGLVQPLLLTEHIQFVADVEAAGRHVEFGQDDRDPVQRGIDARRRFDVVLDAFDGAPQAGETRQREPVKAVVDDLLHAGGIEDRDHGIDEMVFRGVGVGRRFGHVVVAHQRQHAAMLRRACQVGVTEDVARAVDARPLAVPDGKDAVVAPLAGEFRLLRAPAGGGCEFLVQPRLEDDIGRRKLPFRFPQLQVEPAERRAAIAGDEACRVQPRLPVALALHQEHAHDRLCA